MKNNNKEKVNKSHYTHFILENSEKIKKLIAKESDDYYTDAQVVQDLLNFAIEEYKKTDRFTVFGVGVADVIYSEEFINAGIKAYKKKKGVI